MPPRPEIALEHFMARWAVSPEMAREMRDLLAQARQARDEAVEAAAAVGSGGGTGGGAIGWTQVTGKPTTFAPAPHRHDASEIDNLPTGGTGGPTAWADVTGKPASFPPSAHVHAIADTTGLQAALDARAPAAHGHAWADITGAPASYPAAPHVHAWGEVTDKPAAFPPAAHLHQIADVEGLIDALNGGAVPGAHYHAIADVTGLQAALDGKAATTHSHSWTQVTGKPATFAPAAHVHAIADTTGLQAALDGKAATDHAHGWDAITDKPLTFPATAHVHAWSEVTDKPAVFPPADHGHAVADVTGLRGELDGKAALSHGHTVADVTGLQTALDGKAATTHSHSWTQVTGKPATFAPAAHRHDASEIDNLPSGGSTAWADLTGVPADFPPSLHSHPWTDLTGIPATFAPSAHAHPTSDVTGLDTALATKLDASAVSAFALTLLDDATNTAMRTTLGLGTVATFNSIGTSQLANDGVNNTKLANMATGTLKGRATTATGDPEDLTAAQVKTMLAYGIADVANLQGALDGKAAATHTHTIAQVTGLQAALDGKAAASHTHTIAQVTGLQAALDELWARLNTTVSAVGTMSAIRLQGDSGTLAVPSTTFFAATAGSTLAYALIAPPTGVTINSTTGVVSIPSGTKMRNAPVTIRATSGTASADQTFNVTVGPKYGIAIPKSEIFDFSLANLNAAMTRLAGLGITELRMDMIWMDVQTTSAAPNWSVWPGSEYVRIADRAAAAGMDLVFCVHMTPSWARLSGANFNGPGTPSAYASFCANVATHFTSGGRRLVALEVWNEPNLTGPDTFWQYGRPASELAAMQIAAYSAVKAVRPNVLVGMGGLSAVPTTGGDSAFRYIAATEWLTALYDAGFKDYNDFMAIHPYTYPYRWDDGQSNNDGLEVTLACRTLATARGDGGKEWWFTEYGAPTNPPIANSAAVTEAQQAQMFLDLFDWGGANPWLRKVHWYSYYNRTQTTSTDPEDGFGIYDYDEAVEKQIVGTMRTIRKGA